MKKILSTICLIMLLQAYCYANNLVIGNPTYNGTTNKITFTIKWDNSWRVNSGPSNWDAVWVFIKRQPCGANGIWSHAVLSTTSSDHTVTGAYGLVADAVSDGMGVFIHRPAAANNAIGSLVTTSDVTLQLTSTYNPSLIGSSTSSDNFKVFGIEMVYVPQGAFYIGDGRDVNSNNFSNGGNNAAKLINATTQTNGLGVYSNYTSTPANGNIVGLPSTFPLGFNGFYCMKYEISQQQIVDYLNTLTYDQQKARLAVWSTSRLPNVNGTYFSNALNSYRQEIKITTAGTDNTLPAVFGLTNAYNAFLPAGYLNWQDLTSYLDWSGLRPMTEFEYEKACRGTIDPVAYEFPWGNTIINTSNGAMSNNNSSSETMNITTDGLAHYNWDIGPIRSGFAATSKSNRSQSGATYYGIMEMAGNVFEQCVGGGSGYNYANFTTINGDGVLTNTGIANVDGWPINGGTNSGTIIRGGSFYITTSQNFQLQVSNRNYIGGQGINANNTRDRSTGGRGVRSY